MVVRFEDLVMTVIPQPLAQAKLKWCNQHLEPAPELSFSVLASVIHVLFFFINPKAGINLEYDGRCLVVPRANKIFGTVVVHNMD